MTKRASLWVDVGVGAAVAKWTLYVGAGVSAMRVFEIMSMTTDERATKRSNEISRARWAFVGLGLAPATFFLDVDLGWGLKVEMKTGAESVRKTKHKHNEAYEAERAEGRQLANHP